MEATASVLLLCCLLQVTPEASLESESGADGPEVKLITSFEDRNPFSGGRLVTEHATDGKYALRLDRGYASLDAAQNWSGYDFLEVDVYTPAKQPLPLTIEIRDRQTRDYWTRVNYTTVVPPGASTLVVPTALYVGEKSRPGRALQVNAITRLVFALEDGNPAPLYLDNLRLCRDTEPQRMRFDGLWAFDVGPAGSPLMEGFQPLDPSKDYTSERGFGWKKARIWRGFDALQPDPLYRDFLCLEQGGLAIDLPNGKYHVFVNLDSPSGYWGEVQRYRRRAVLVEGVRHEETMDLASFRRRYFRFADREDLPEHNTFDRYQIPYFREKHLIADVRDGQLNLDFEGENWACCVSAIVVYPADKADEGKKFLDFVQKRRRFHFNNAFKRVIHQPPFDKPQPTASEQDRGFLAFARDYMQEVYSNDRPDATEQITQLTGSAFAGEYEPLTVSIYPLRDLGTVTVSATDLVGPGRATLPCSTLAIHHVQHRITRVTAEGSVYTLRPRRLIPGASAPVPAEVTRTFWLTMRVPTTAQPGVYEGQVTLTPQNGKPLTLPLRFTVRQGTLDEVDIPVGPWGHTIDLPWYAEESADWNQQMAKKSLRKLREYGFTTASGLPILTYRGFENGQPRLDFSRGDAQMQMFREEGFRQPVVTYCPLIGLELYKKDESAMRDAGFRDYSEFVARVFGAIQRHAEQADWLPIYWNLGDEPLGDELIRGSENAEAFRRAFPKGPPYFTAATSFRGTNRNDPHFRFSKALHIANWNDHDEAGVQALHSVGGDWAFYNGGNRWTYGFYLYKAAKQYRMKFRLSWHWNIVAGDPNYALDCREDDYAWCYASPEGELIPTVHFEQLREGLDDYRRLLTLERLSREKNSARGRAVLDEVLSSFRLGEREQKNWTRYAKLRQKVDAAIEELR